MAKTSFEEEVYLRALTGRVVGKALADLGFNRVAVAALRNTICSSLAAATEASFIAYSGGVTRHFAVEPGKEDEAAGRLASWRPEVTVVQFGGETPVDMVKASFAAFVGAMAERGVEGSLVVHVRTLAAGGLEEALKAPRARGYLAERGVYTYTVNLDAGSVIVNRVVLEGEGFRLEPLREYQVTLEHAELLNRSIRGRTLRFVEA
jgi:hypothetical protein